jgi:hypothetical protein
LLLWEPGRGRLRPTGEFDVSRPKNRHVGFGGGGPHFCMGAGLARPQLRTVFGELLARVRDMEVGEPNLARGNFIRVVERLHSRAPTSPPQPLSSVVGSRELPAVAGAFPS